MELRQEGCSRVELLRHLENIIMKEYALKFWIGLSRSGFERVTSYHLHTIYAQNKILSYP